MVLRAMPATLRRRCFTCWYLPSLLLCLENLTWLSTEMNLIITFETGAEVPYCEVEARQRAKACDYFNSAGADSRSGWAVLYRHQWQRQPARPGQPSVNGLWDQAIIMQSAWIVPVAYCAVCAALFPFCPFYFFYWFELFCDSLIWLLYKCKKLSNIRTKPIR